MLKGPHKIIGILGGMGPYATLAFWQKILDMTPANKDWDHLHLIIDNNTKIPSRTRHVLYNEPSPVPDMIESCRKLAAYPVDMIAIPCNSASYYIDQIAPYCTVPIANIIEVSCRAARKKAPMAKTALVLGGHTTYLKQSYRPFIEKENMTYVSLSEEEQQIIEEFIERIKHHPGTASSVGDIQKGIKDIIKRHNPDCLILGCTEFGCIPMEKFDITIIDSSHELADYIIKTVG